LRKWTELQIPITTGAATTALVYPAESGNAVAALILAHGAGAGQRHPFMTGFAGALAGRDLDVVTFNFLYTEQKRRIPDRAPALEACYRAVIAHVVANLASASARLVIGGKSMGGRIATQVAAAEEPLPIDGLVLLGYPLHPPGRPEQRRDAHLPQVGHPMLFVQGSRDAFGTPGELTPVLHPLGDATLYIVEGGDHSFALARKDPERQARVYADVQEKIAGWIGGLTSRPARTRRPPA
jgi:predicted alpha/beta-hydrolase family hydrolase